MYNKQCSPLFSYHSTVPHSFVVKSIHFFLVLTDYGVSRQVFFVDKRRGFKRQDATLKLSDVSSLTRVLWLKCDQTNQGLELEHCPDIRQEAPGSCF